MSTKNNFCCISGRLTNYQERVAAGKTVSSFNVQQASVGKDKDPMFFPVEAWSLAADIRQQLNTGVDKVDVQVVGEVRQDSWVDKKTGTKRTKLYISAQTVFVMAQGKQSVTPVTQSDSTPVVVSSTEKGAELPF